MFKTSLKNRPSIHQSGVLINREKSVFYSFQSSKQPIRFHKITQASKIRQDNLFFLNGGQTTNWRIFFNDVINTCHIL